jgi:tyrosyl-tRNA synthetase
MVKTHSEFIDTLVSRGFLHQCTDLDRLDAAAADGRIVAYIGFDCTADSLHVGSLVPIMLLRILQRSGHKPIVLLGGGTSKVGDPAGKDKSRKLLDESDIERNMAGIKQTFAKFIDFGEGPSDASFVNNAEWLDSLAYLAFLRDYGRHFSVNRMLSFDSVKLRLEREHPLSFLEFNYMVLQAFDFLELSRRHGCTLQMGGSDQWGNIVSGIELIRRIESKPAFGLTAPLIVTASGEKMGKTAKGAVWLNEERLSAYDYFQFWRNTEDADVGRFLRLFTDLPLSEITLLEKLEGTEINEAKKTLAYETTKLCHGKDKAKAAAETARQTFDEGGIGAELPTIEVARSDLEQGIPAFDMLRRAGLAASNSEARRIVRGGGGRINDVTFAAETRLVTLDDLNDNGVIKISAGRKHHALIRVI